ncbi:MAG: SpoIIE family protein phosphatase [Treponema sp.]|jgi:serine phosphatase RsbU (regulator of sigma subunit)|nr:SpoIIE family protein phosphatase [Treponema sp.]
MFNSYLAIIAVAALLCAIGLFAAVRGAVAAAGESASLKAGVHAILTGDFMPLEKKERLSKLKKRGIGLRFKIAFFTIALALLVVVMISIPLYYIMTQTQQETLLQGLWDRSTVLLEGLASSAQAYLPSKNVEGLGLLPVQAAVIPEATYVTITGRGEDSSFFGDYVWVTNDPNIDLKVDTPDLEPGISRLSDRISPRLPEISRELDTLAREKCGVVSQTISELTLEAESLALLSDPESLLHLNDIRVTIRALESTLAQTLNGISRQVHSEPAFSVRHISPDGNHLYIFFKPIMYRGKGGDTFFEGLIRLGISTESIVGQITRGQMQLLRIILIVALAALAIGVIGALAFSTLIIQPIRKLVRHVEIIRDTENKAKLAGLDIRIGTNDEIMTLGDTVNDMTQSLVKATIAASDLSIGKEIQKKFIPLEMDQEGNKLSSGYKDTPNAEFFGYYEGAKGVSGDYFDYLDLDGRYYAIIKCDVAGKGVPAALLMIQVATMFLNYFKQWKPSAQGMLIEQLVYQINNFFENLGFEGRFAAFTLCLFDSQTGVLRFCNAGDNLIHYYDASEGRFKIKTLPETPATGALPNSLVKSKGGYEVQIMTFDHGDILLLYTDGIEEAKRTFRDSGFKEILCTEGPDGTPHENHVAGQWDEELGPVRVQRIIDAVMNQGVYTLRKWHNGEGDKPLHFNFASCEGRVEEVIMALVAVEKMFRCYKDPRAGEDSRILVDKKIDEFLKAHFLEYRDYCADTRAYPGNDAYMYYTHLNEDEQYDDLTILGIKRK